jgi:hypothetical protein
MTDAKKDSEPEIPIDSDEERKKQAARRDKAASREEPNPPHTTTGFFTAPKFGAAGSGGLEIEPGLEKD